MARTSITPQRLNTLAGEDIAFVDVDVANGMQFQNTGIQVLLVQAGSGESVTVAIPSTPDGFGRVGDVTGVVVSSALGTQVKAFGPFNPATIWGDAASLAFADFSAKTGSPKVAVITI